MRLSELPTEILDRVCRYLTHHTDYDHQHDTDIDMGDRQTSLSSGEDGVDGESRHEDNDDNDDSQSQLDGNPAQGGDATITERAGNLRRSLLDLCLASRRLRCLAEPYLYAYFDQRSDRTVPFLRHMVDHPHHAEYVHYLRIEPYMED